MNLASRSPLASITLAILLATPLNAALSDEFDQLRSQGALVLPIAQEDDRIDVGFHLSDAKVSGETLKLLHPFAERLVALNLRGTEIDDAAAKELAPLTALTKLHLEKTQITNASLPHFLQMKELEYLNVYGTEVGDAVLRVARELPKLKKLYVWQTNVTPSAVRRFQQSRPGVEVIGIDLMSDLAMRTPVAAPSP
ncbi:hypothetical protein [Stratiformator vulcanicus]|uniref:Leucine Rich repeats (2 copies) n=1 Tax=Stratiformator vulcanicus TaxID=2527980 RepID=A0A517R1V7_9PLAN|nr:hypothetical protein [Stratiformator vulcanicus]QDT37860.1 Leucine Rich repeats (2 copies) [Stratiformator vulcanicus]